MSALMCRWFGHRVECLRVWWTSIDLETFTFKREPFARWFRCSRCRAHWSLES